MPQRGIFTESGTFQHGYLYKQSKMIGLFRKRYIVMDGNKLYSYKSDEIFNQHQQQYTEVFDLNMYSKVQITVNKYYIKRFEFTIFSETGDSRRFRCNSEFELRSWVNTITHTHQRLRRNHLILHFAGVKPPETCITTTYSEHITSIITIQTTLTEKDTVSALKNVIRKTYDIPSHKDLLIIYSDAIISKHDDLTLQRLCVTTNSLLLLAINADKHYTSTDSVSFSSSSDTNNRADSDSTYALWDDHSIRTPPPSPSPMRRNFAYLNLSQLASGAHTTFSALETHAFSTDVTPPIITSSPYYSLPTRNGTQQEDSLHLKRKIGFDIITQEDKALVYRMSCGHWMNRESLYMYAMSVFNDHYNTRIALKCPHTMDDEKHSDTYWSCRRCTYYNTYDITRCEMCSAPKPERSMLCDTDWDYSQIKKILTDKMDEKEVDKLVTLELYNARNVIENECNVQKCVGCDTLYYRENDDIQSLAQCVMCVQSTFCWLCGAKWDNGHVCDLSFRLELAHILKRALSKTIDDVMDVPSIRCCPNCCQLITHSDACKHMKCRSCKTDFCFICLKQKKYGSWQCGFVCAVAQRQKANTLPMKKKRFKLF
eukprot:219029_1